MQMTDKELVPYDDEGLVRWVAMLLIEGKKESQIRRQLNDNSIFQSPLPPEQWNLLMLSASTAASDMRSMVISRAELGSTDFLRLDSYTRRKKNMHRLERIIDRAEGEADSVSKLNSVSFMVGGLIKAQESMDKFTGAQEAVPQVQVNIGYDPLDQFRTVIQAHSNIPKVIDIISDEEE
tara:strand:+ start:1034 stop:1570 length:537 start_codon:yes stop_codon:yes gene_type:complete